MYLRLSLMVLNYRTRPATQARQGDQIQVGGAPSGRHQGRRRGTSRSVTVPSPFT